MQSSHLEKVFYHYIDLRPEIEDQVLSRFYTNKEIKLAHDIRKEFRKKYMTAPTAGQMKQICKLKNLSEQLSDEQIDILYNEDVKQYEREWLDEVAECWVEYKTLDYSVLDLVAYMKTTKVTTDNIKDVVQTVKTLITDRNNIDFKFDEGSDFFDPETHKQHVSERFSTGYPYLDTVLGGGYSPKTLIAFCGIPKVGKCTHSSTVIRIRNKKTGEIKETTIGEFCEQTKQHFLSTGHITNTL